MNELFELQQRLVATKTNWNEFSSFSYRSLEDILMKAKPLLNELKCVIKLNDEMVLLGDRFYVKSTATLQNEKGETETATGWAREPLDLKGMSAPQVTGTASSYARKYALASLLAIDDNKDVDSMDNRVTTEKAKLQTKPTTPTTTTNTKEVPESPVSNLDALTFFCKQEKTEENKEQITRFYNYYKGKCEKWVGVMNFIQLWENWQKPRTVN